MVGLSVLGKVLGNTTPGIRSRKYLTRPCLISSSPMDMLKASRRTFFLEAIPRLQADGTTTTSHEHFNPTRWMSSEPGFHAHRTPRRYRHHRDSGGAAVA